MTIQELKDAAKISEQLEDLEKALRDQSEAGERLSSTLIVLCQKDSNLRRTMVNAAGRYLVDIQNQLYRVYGVSSEDKPEQNDDE